MKKVNESINKLRVDNSNDMLREEYIKALKDESFKKICKSLSFKEEDLMKYTSKLQECALERTNCSNCKGLFDCKNLVKGSAFTPSVVNEALTFSYDICKYSKALIEENKYQNNMLYFDVPKEIRNAKMSEIYATDKKRVEIIKWLNSFIENYSTNNKGLYLNGNFGSGKTYLIAALFNELAKKNIKGAIVYWPEFLRSLKNSFDTNFNERYEYVKKVPLLLIDDIGAENLTAWSRDEILGAILQYRMQESATTFFTSNFTLEELEKHFSESTSGSEKIKAQRIIERIRQLTNEMSLVSKNNRN